MDVRSLGSAHLDTARLGGNLMARQRDSGPNLATFEEMLRNSTRSSAAADSPEAGPRADAAPPASSSPVTAQELVGSAPRGVRIDRESELFQQCLELETFLIKLLISSKRDTIQRSGLIEQSFAGKMYEDMLFDEHARKLAQNAGFGLAEMAYLELTGQRGRVVLR